MYEKGMVKSRERAKALIMEGRVFVEDKPVTKAGTMITPGARIELKGEELPYVSRGGLKLEAALAHFGIDLRDKIVMDVGSSTGGFTDCMLQKGARKVYCIDVGYGQLSWPLRKDPRVILHERTNIRYLRREKIPEVIGFATIDISFISLKHVLSKVAEFVKKGGEILALVKPQFEVGRGEVGKGGIVREEDRRLAVVDSMRTFAEEKGLRSLGIFRSPIPGQKGNIEYFLFLRRNNGRDEAPCT
jgi:23S rRNA (cytidine1920-2'-O)/16S rRNA (cytidine1409-2'-O)-methyltransferase